MKNIKGVFFLMTMLSVGCYNQGSKIDDFTDFRHNFYADSLFQVNHIVFPLKGIDSDRMEIDDTVYVWQQKEDWQFINDMTKYGDVITDISKNDSIVTELSHLDYGGLWFLTQFKKINNDWFLIRFEKVY